MSSGGTNRSYDGGIPHPTEDEHYAAHAGNTPFLWMRREAAANGLVFKSEEMAWCPDDVGFGREDTVSSDRLWATDYLDEGVDDASSFRVNCGIPFLASVMQASEDDLTVAQDRMSAMTVNTLDDVINNLTTGLDGIGGERLSLILKVKGNCLLLVMYWYLSDSRPHRT